MPPITVEGVCEGRIAFARVATAASVTTRSSTSPNTIAQWRDSDESIKNKISHRARAAVKAKEILREWIKNTSEVLRIKLRKSDDDGHF